MRSALAATFLIVLLAMSCAYCATAPASSLTKVPHLGGPRYRVFDTEEIDSVDEIPSLRALYRIAEECTGQTRAWSPVRLFSVSKIEVKYEYGWSSAAVGMWAIGTGWIYVKRGRTPMATTRTIVHEYAHYIMQQHHPGIDETITACNAYVNARAGE